MNGWTDFDEPCLIRREIERTRKGLLSGCILWRDFRVFLEKNNFSMCNYGIFTLRTGIVDGIVDFFEYLFSNLIEWDRITCKI